MTASARTSPSWSTTLPFTPPCTDSNKARRGSRLFSHSACKKNTFISNFSVFFWWDTKTPQPWLFRTFLFRTDCKERFYRGRKLWPECLWGLFSWFFCFVFFGGGHVLYLKVGWGRFLGAAELDGDLEAVGEKVVEVLHSIVHQVPATRIRLMSTIKYLQVHTNEIQIHPRILTTLPRCWSPCQKSRSGKDISWGLIVFQCFENLHFHP